MITYTVISVVVVIAAGIVTGIVWQDYKRHNHMDWYLLVLDVVGAIIVSLSITMMLGLAFGTTTWKNESITLVGDVETRVQKSQTHLFGENVKVIDGSKTRTLVYDVNYSKDGISRELVHEEP